MIKPRTRLLVYFLGLLVLLALAVYLKDLWHKGGSVFFFYTGALIFGLILAGYGTAMTFFPARFLAFFGRHEGPHSPLWRRAELLSAGLVSLLVGSLTLGMLVYNLQQCLRFDICLPVYP